MGSNLNCFCREPSEDKNVLSEEKNKIEEVEDKLAQVKEILRINIEKELSRQDDIDRLAERLDDGEVFK
jgi:ferritin